MDGPGRTTMTDPTLSGSAYYNNASNGFASGTLDLTVTNGDLILVAIEVDNGTAPTSVTDDIGHTYTLAYTMSIAGIISGGKVFVYKATATSSVALTVTVTFAATEPAQMIGMDWANASLSSGTNTVGTVSTAATGSLTTAQANCVVVSWVFFIRPTGTTSLSMVPAGTVLESGGASPGLAILAQYAAEATSGTAVTSAGSDTDASNAIIAMFEVDGPAAPSPGASSVVTLILTTKSLSTSGQLVFKG